MNDIHAIQDSYEPREQQGKRANIKLIFVATCAAYRRLLPLFALVVVAFFAAALLLSIFWL